MKFEMKNGSEIGGEATEQVVRGDSHKVFDFFIMHDDDTETELGTWIKEPEVE